MQGINNHIVHTMGSTKITLNMENHSIESIFHVVPSSFPLTQNGIAGKPFLQANRVNSKNLAEGYLTTTYDAYCQIIRDKIIFNSNIKEVEGNLFEATDDFTLAHCVSEDFKMSQGIALEFRRRFGLVDELLRQNKKITEIAYITSNDIQILYLITKQRYKDKPTLETTFLTLKNLRTFCQKQNITQLAMPRLGSGQDQLNCDQVRTMLRFIFRGSKIKILIFVNTQYSEGEKRNIIEEFHVSPLGGHQGVSRTVKRIKQQHTWKGLIKDVVQSLYVLSNEQKQ